MLFRKNNINIGIGLGILLPVVAFQLLWLLSQAAQAPFKMRSVALVAICLNLWLVQAFKKNKADMAIRGVVLVTVALAFIWAFWFFEEIRRDWA